MASDSSPPSPARFEWRRTQNVRRLAFWALIALIAALLVYYLVVRIYLPAGEGPGGKLRLVIYGFSTQEEVFTQAIFPAFEQLWEAEHGGDLAIESQFGASGSLAGEINLGAPADIALFSNAEHTNWLKIGRMVDEETQPVIYACTPMIVVTRPGNPYAIQSYADLAQPGLHLLHADPRSSGGGQWAVLAEYGSAIEDLNSGAIVNATGGATVGGAEETAARGQLQAIWQNVRLMSASARGTLAQFELGAGDAFITYEHDALQAQERGALLQVVTPPRTILAQPVAVLVDKNLSAAERPAAQAFIDFLLSPTDGQALLERYHLRPIFQDASCLGEPALEQPFVVEDLGGWSQAYNQIVENIWKATILPGLELEPASLIRN